MAARRATALQRVDGARFASESYTGASRLLWVRISRTRPMSGRQRRQRARSGEAKRRRLDRYPRPCRHLTDSMSSMSGAVTDAKPPLMPSTRMPAMARSVRIGVLPRRDHYQCDHLDRSSQGRRTLCHQRSTGGVTSADGHARDRDGGVSPLTMRANQCRWSFSAQTFPIAPERRSIIRRRAQ